MSPWQRMISLRCRGPRRRTFDRVRIVPKGARPRVVWNSLVAVIRMPMSRHVGAVDLGNSKYAGLKRRGLPRSGEASRRVALASRVGTIRADLVLMQHQLL